MKAQDTVLAQMLLVPWWAQLIRGLLAFGFGIYAIMQPTLTVATLILFMGVYLFLDGVFLSFRAITGKTGSIKRGYVFFRSLISIGGGLVVFFHPFMATIVTTAMLGWLIGFAALTGGIMEVSSGFSVEKGTNNQWTAILSGILSCVLGIIFLTSPVRFGFSLGFLVGIFALIGGFICMANSIKFRQWESLAKA